MAQPMTPAPEADLGPVVEALRKAAKFGAGFVSPEPRSPGAVLVAAIRSGLPGSGSFRNEYDRYNEAAGPEDSVMGRYSGQLPGESLKDAFMRQAMSPESERLSAMAGGMAAPLVVHASPVKWSGQPTRAKAGTGEGGAAYGEGLYGSIPANAKGIDARYRERQGLDTTPAITVKGEDIRQATLPMDATYYLTNELRPFLEGEVKTPNIEDALFWAKTKLRSQVDWTRKALEESMAKGHSAAVENHSATLAQREAGLAALDALTPADLSAHVPGEGSFHVWDVPDRLLDWDAKGVDQSPDVAASLRERLASTGALEPGIDAYMKHGSGRDMYELLRGDRGLDGRAASDTLKTGGVVGHRYLGEAGSSGESQGVPNFVIYDDAAVKPLGTFNSAEEFLSSALYKQLESRIRAEEAALVERYPHLKSYFGKE